MVDAVRSNNLINNGWCTIDSDDHIALSDRLLQTARSLGTPVTARKSVGILQDIYPTKNVQFHKSLTAKYLDGEFPLHVDTAHWLSPCRYVVMGCLEVGNFDRETTLINFGDIHFPSDIYQTLFTEPFKIENGKNSFYGTILNKSREFIRYDPGCMTPTSRQGEILMSFFEKDKLEYAVKPINWVKGRILVIDNWRVLHGRNPGNFGTSERLIRRVLVK
jgi:Taurine catabolism dioxygenase TauD, TfdA family